MFSKEELLRFANIFDNAGQVFLGVMVLSPLVSGIDRGIAVIVPLGLVFTFGCWFASWKLTRMIRKRIKT